ncbi:MAG TPA: hypothetical protein VK610_09505, partial [Rhodothermales bacterium]|nr:hypothetical protein [Rhodothermales bacterium]
YLIGWAYCVSIALGALLFVMIQHVVKARWSTTLRRIPETLAAGFPLLALMGTPILFGLHDLFHWSHADIYHAAGAEFDRVLAGKAGYFFWPLEPGGFPLFWFGRLVAYFLLWSYLGRRLWKLSVGNDIAPDAANTIAARKTSAWGIPITGVAISFAAYDILMSLDPHWFSTIFGVYFFAGGWWAALALIGFTAMLWRHGGLLHDEITTEHLQDIGKFMFGFTVFWTYIAFSQYMLYWYGNLPEEIRWYQTRFTNGWEYLSWALLIGHFVIPFLALLPRVTKRMLPFFAFMCVWALVMHWMDFAWLALPTLHVTPEGAEHGAALGQTLLDGARVLPAALQEMAGHGEANVAAGHGAQASFSWLDFAAGLGLFLVWYGAAMWRAGRHAITPYNDPYFRESLRFENV